MATSVDPNLVTTATELHGYRVVRHLGIVRGIVVRSRSVFGTVGASLQTLVGGNITIFTSLCEKTRQESFDLLLQHAGERGRQRDSCDALRRQRGDERRDGGPCLRHGRPGGADQVAVGRVFRPATGARTDGSRRRRARGAARGLRVTSLADDVF